MPSRTWICLGAALVTAAVVSTACSSSGSGGQSGSKSPYVIGGDQDMSNALAYIGNGLAQGAEAYFKQLNAAGGVNGHQVKYVPLDHKSDTATGLANIKQLATQDHAIAVLGFDSSVVAAAAVAPLAQDKIVGVVQGSAPDTLQSPWMFAGAAYIADEAPSMVALAQHLVNAPLKAGILNQVSTVLTAWHNNVVPDIKKANGQVVSDQSVTLAATDVSAQAQAIANAKPNVVFSTMSGSKIQLAVNALRKFGYQGPIISHTAAADEPSLKAVHDPNFYVLREFAFAEDDSPAVTKMDSAIKSVGADPDAAWVINGYVQAYIITQGLKACGNSCTGDSLRKAMETVSVDTKGLAFGNLAYSSTSHAGFSALKAYHWDTATNAPTQVDFTVPYSVTIGVKG